MTAFDIAQRYVGMRELSDKGKDHPFIQWCFTLCGLSAETPDEVPWCSAFMQHAPWELRLPRSKSAAARSWLLIGIPKRIEDAQPGANDIVILKRGTGAQPGPEVIAAQGHVGLVAGVDLSRGTVDVLAGNQNNQVCVLPFPITQVLGVRRLAA